MISSTAIDRKMVRNELFITVPSFFKCPISLDVMKSPVSLCTGVTYDRSSIQAWLDNGNNTCPATMQVLDSKDFIPNHTLHRLIQIWSNSINNNSSDVSPSNLHRVSQQQVKDLTTKISKGCFYSLSKIVDFAQISDENRKFLAQIDGLVPELVSVVSNDSKLREKTIALLDQILPDYEDKNLMKSMARNSELLASLILILQKGNSDSKIGSAKVLEFISVDPESKILISETPGMLMELLRLIGFSESNTEISAGLSCLISLSGHRRVKVGIIRLGVVEKLGKILHNSSNSNCDSTRMMIEKTLKLLEMVSTCTEGRTAICEDPICVGGIVEKMLKVSKVATEHGAVILWSVCYLFRDQRAEEGVMKSNGLTKILLLMQSNCSPSVRHMCCDLMKIFRVNSKSCLSSYDTKTTHIMPF